MGPPSQCIKVEGCRAARRGQGSTTPARRQICGWFPSDAACLELPRLAALAGRVLVSGVPCDDGVEARGRSVVLRRLRSASVGHGRDDLSWDADSVDGLVRRWVADDQPEARHLGARAQADAGDRFGADRVGDAASLPHGDGPFRSRAPDRRRGTRAAARIPKAIAAPRTVKRRVPLSPCMERGSDPAAGWSNLLGLAGLVASVATTSLARVFDSEDAPLAITLGQRPVLLLMRPLWLA